MADEQPPHPKLDTTVPHSARIWNYWLGGIDNYPVDRAAGDAYVAMAPGIVAGARATRAFLGRAVRYLVDEVGIWQLLDIGTGLPTHENTHEIAQRINPECRIVYVDNDPLVLVHARALLNSTPQGATQYVDADMREPGKVIRDAAELLDLRQPVGLLFMGVLGHVADYDEARAVVNHLLAALPAGSYLAIVEALGTDQAMNQAQQGYDDTGAMPYALRSPEQVARFFDGLDLVEPGLVPAPDWRPDTTQDGPVVPTLSGVARKP